MLEKALDIEKSEPWLEIRFVNYGSNCVMRLTGNMSWSVFGTVAANPGRMNINTAGEGRPCVRFMQGISRIGQLIAGCLESRFLYLPEFNSNLVEAVPETFLQV